MSNKALSKLKRVNSGKRRGETPDGSSQMTPTASTESISKQDQRDRMTSLDAVLDTPEIAALAVDPEDLIKLHPPRPTSADLAPQQPPSKVFVKHPIATVKTPEKKKSKRVGVLHPLPPGTVVPISKQLVMTQPGPRFDEEGTFIGHSVLGKPLDFASELEHKKIIKSVSDFIRPPPIIEPKVAKPTKPVEMSDKETTPPKEKHALEQWNKSMTVRKAQQQSLAEKMQRTPQDLTMNTGEEYRRFQEERTLIDRAIPLHESGKGYRTGSEFWKLPERLGDEETGIQYTLTKTERGQPPEVEYIGMPSVVCKEKGIDIAKDFGGSNLPYSRRPDSYFHTRREVLKKTLNDLEHFRPDFSKLQVIGHAPGSKKPASTSTAISTRIRADSLDSVGEDEEGEGSTDSSQDTESEHLTGPALKVGHTLLQWTGPPRLPSPPSPSPTPPPLSIRESRSDTVLDRSRRRSLPPRNHLCKSAKDPQFPNSGGTEEEEEEEEEEVELEPIKCRVLLECSAGEIATSHLEMGNCGSTAVYYSWEPIAKPNPLGTVQAGDKQRFYFDTRGGVLLPGKEIQFPFYFKSPNPGIFSEMWVLATSPVMNKGRPVVVTLKGVAFQEDLYRKRREEIERAMVHREAVAAVERIMERVVQSIRTPPRSPTVRETVLMEEDFFQQQNPEMYYHHDVVQQLKHLHNVTLCPELFQEQASLTPASFPSKGEKSGGKKGEEKSGGPSKKGGGAGGAGPDRGTARERKGKMTAAPAKEEAAEPAPEPQLPVEIPKWDLSITSLLRIIMNVEDEASREDKLKQLNQLVNGLSFPPPTPTTMTPYQLCYIALCEAVDEMVDVSSHLCQVMGLPCREWEESRGKTGSEEHNILSIPASPVHGKGKGDKKSGGSKDKKKPPSKAERERTPTLTKGKKHQRGSSPKGTDTAGVEINEATSTIDIDPILDQKYKINFLASVHRILEQTVDKIVMLIESEKPAM